MWVLAVLGLVTDAAAEDCFGAITFHVTLDVETTPPGASIDVVRAPDPAFRARRIGTSPLAWDYDYEWRWETGNCDGAAPDNSWGAGPGQVVSSLDVYDTFAITASLEGYEAKTIPVRVYGCQTHSTVMRKAFLGQLKKLAEVRQCMLDVVMELTPSTSAPVEVAPTPLTAERMLIGCTTDTDCPAESRCDIGVCVLR
jgi:hypothetical protein